MKQSCNLLCLSLCNLFARKTTNLSGQCPYSHRQQNPELAQLNTHTECSVFKPHPLLASAVPAEWSQPSTPRKTPCPCPFSRRLCHSFSSSSSLWGRVPHVHGGTKPGFALGGVWRAAAHLEFPSKYSSECIWWLTQEMDTEERISRPLFNRIFIP